MVEVHHDGPQMARLDPRVSRMRYRMERLMLTPLFRFGLRVGLPFALCFGGGSLWFSDDANRDAFTGMIAEVQATVQNRPEFQVRVMAVDGASVEVAELVRAEIPVDFPISSFDLDLEVMQARVRALDPVKSADMRIRQGGVLQVDVVERQPVALWRSEAGLFLLDDEGVRVGPARSRGDHVELPVIAGDLLRPDYMAVLTADPRALFPDTMPEEEREARRREHRHKADTARGHLREVITEALALYQAAAPLHGRLRGFERMGGRRWDVVLDRDQRILLPETGAVRALEHVTALALAPQVDLLSRDLLAVDLRLPQRPTIRMSDEAMQEMWRIKAMKAGADQ